VVFNFLLDGHHLQVKLNRCAVFLV
jgi:hypothetical protein